MLGETTTTTTTVIDLGKKKNAESECEAYNQDVTQLGINSKITCEL